MEWSNRAVLDLVDEYRRAPILWNPDHVHYKNKTLKRAAWNEVAAKFGQQHDEVERKINILLSQYRRERLKLVRRRRLGYTDSTTSRWYAYEGFKFLETRKKRHSVGGRIDYRDAIAHSEVVVKTDEGMMGMSDEEHIETRTITATTTTTTTTAPSSSSSSLAIEEKLVPINELIVGNDIRDEWAVFGEIVAIKLRKLVNPEQRCLVQHKIQTILYQAELDNFKYNK